MTDILAVEARLEATLSALFSKAISSVAFLSSALHDVSSSFGSITMALVNKLNPTTISEVISVFIISIVFSLTAKLGG